MSTEQLLIKALLKIEGCATTCQYSCFLNGYTDCSKNWCKNHCDYKLDINKLKREFNL
jgi:hypothetical protein